MTKEKAIEIITNALQSDENKYTAEIDKALSIIQKIIASIPEKHGRLIDGDMLKAEIEEMAGYDEAEQFNDYYLCEQPVILEAEGSE